VAAALVILNRVTCARRLCAPAVEPLNGNGERRAAVFELINNLQSYRAAAGAY
jgi:hypothetical protein